MRIAGHSVKKVHGGHWLTQLEGSSQSSCHVVTWTRLLVAQLMGPPPELGKLARNAKMGFDDPFWNPLSGEQAPSCCPRRQRTAFSKPRIASAVACSGPPDVPLRVVPAVLRCGRDCHGRAWWKLVRTVSTLLLHSRPHHLPLFLAVLFPAAWCHAASPASAAVWLVRGWVWSSAFVVVHTQLNSLLVFFQPMTANGCRFCTP